jgi:zinc finger protein
MTMPYPFHWVPGEGQRHASLDSRPGGGYPTGMTVTTLCQQRLSADNTELGWLWPTCRSCNEEAHRIARRLTSTGKSSFRVNIFERTPTRDER